MPKTRRPGGARLPGILLGLWAVFPAAAYAQPFHLDAPADSPLWWSLSDEVSPQQLREAYLAPGSSQRRYREAVAAGLEEAKSEKELRSLKFYLNTKLTPELETLGNAFHLFAHGWLPAEDRAATARALAEHGVTPEGAQQILDISDRYAAEFRRRNDEISPKHQELIRLQWEILDQDGSEQTAARVDQAVREADVGYLVQKTGRDEAEIRDLLEAWGVLPSSVVLTALLPELKAALSPGDWRGLRRYLLGRVSRDLGAFSDWRE